MAINYNSKDFNVSKIFDACGFDGKKSKYEYRIYGLSNDGNPAVLLEYRGGFDPSTLQPIMNFLNKNRISCRISAAQDGKRHVYIGLRHDVRSTNPDLAVKVVKTVIYHCEGILEKADFNETFKLKQFKDRTGKVKKADRPQPKLAYKSEPPQFKWDDWDDGNF